jgi:hypothetical protein
MNTQLSGNYLRSDMPATYRIRVQGSIKTSWIDRFEGMTICETPASQYPDVTILSGRLADQAALVGVLNSLHTLRLAVLSVECMDEAPVERLGKHSQSV